MARSFGIPLRRAASQLASLRPARHWIFCLLPSEILTESLEASLFEWKLRPASEVADIPSCSVVVKEEAKNSWVKPSTSTRLVPKGWSSWDGPLPRHDPRSLLLQGDLLRFRPMPPGDLVTSPM